MRWGALMEGRKKCQQIQQQEGTPWFSVCLSFRLATNTTTTATTAAPAASRRPPPFLRLRPNSHLLWRPLYRPGIPPRDSPLLCFLSVLPGFFTVTNIRAESNMKNPQSLTRLDIREKKQVFSVSRLWIYHDMTLVLWPPAVWIQTTTQSPS